MPVTGGGSNRKLGGHLAKLKQFSIVKIEFLWRTLKYLRGAMTWLPTSATYDAFCMVYYCKLLRDTRTRAHIQLVKMDPYFLIKQSRCIEYSNTLVYNTVANYKSVMVLVKRI